MNRSTNYINIPAIKLISKKEYSKGTAVHIGWKDVDGKPFCLCGQEAIVGNTTGLWANVSYEDYPEITCGRCKAVWMANRMRKGDTVAPRAMVLRRMMREHLKSTNHTTYNYISADIQHPSDEAYHKSNPTRLQSRRLQSGATLIGVRENGLTHVAITAPHTNNAIAVCNHNIEGTLIGCSEDEYKQHPYITCPDCIEYLKKHDLDVSFEVMEARRKGIANLLKWEEYLRKQLDATRAEYNTLIVKTI